MEGLWKGEAAYNGRMRYCLCDGLSEKVAKHLSCGCGFRVWASLRHTLFE
jgi:hypothetical protein